MHIGINQTWHGKKVSSLSQAELLSMKNELKEKGFVINTFVFDQDGTGEVIESVTGKANTYTEKPKTDPLKARSTVININGKSYSSWSEAIEDAKKNGTTVIQSNGSSVTIRNGVISMGGNRVGSYDDSQAVNIFICGDTGDVSCDNGSVTIFGNAKNVETNNGSIKAETIEGNAESNCGSIKAETIKGRVEANMGSVIYNGE